MQELVITNYTAGFLSDLMELFPTGKVEVRAGVSCFVTTDPNAEEKIAASRAIATARMERLKAEREAREAGESE